MRCNGHRKRGACGFIGTACTIKLWDNYAKRRCYAKYDTACTNDERFERPWHPLKRISIKKHICSRIVLPHIYKNIEIFVSENQSYLGEFEAEFKKALAWESEAKG
jgi:hypothetical protein